MDNSLEQRMDRADAWQLNDGDVSFWYRPWTYTHPSWVRNGDRALIDLSRSEEMMQRVLYPDWCRQFSLPRHPVDYDGSIWWKIAVVASEVFERANHLVGLVLVFARNRRDGFSIARSSGLGANDGDLRWVLQNACFVPKAVLDMDGWEGITEPEFSGFMSLRFAVNHAAPCLVERLSLRYRCEHAQRETVTAVRCREPADEARSVRFIERLWINAIARCGVDIAGLVQAKVAIESHDEQVSSHT